MSEVVFEPFPVRRARLQDEKIPRRTSLSLQWGRPPIRDPGFRAAPAIGDRHHRHLDGWAGGISGGQNSGEDKRRAEAGNPAGAGGNGSVSAAQAW